MNFLDVLKQIKAVRESLSKMKEELKSETITYEDERIKIVGNAAGEILDLEIKDAECSHLKEALLKAHAAFHEEVKKKLKEKAQSSLLGESFGLF